MCALGSTAFIQLEGSRAQTRSCSDCEDEEVVGSTYATKKGRRVGQSVGDSLEETEGCLAKPMDFTYCKGGRP